MGGIGGREEGDVVGEKLRSWEVGGELPEFPPTQGRSGTSCWQLVVHLSSDSPPRPVQLGGLAGYGVVGYLALLAGGSIMGRSVAVGRRARERERSIPATRASKDGKFIHGSGYPRISNLMGKGMEG